MDMTDIGAFEAKTRLSELLEQVARGRSFRITRRGKPIAELRPIGAAVHRPAYGIDRGRVEMSRDFDAPLDEFAGYR